MKCEDTYGKDLEGGIRRKFQGIILPFAFSYRQKSQKLSSR